MIGPVSVGTPPPPAGAVFVYANSATNKVRMYNLGADGQLGFVSAFDTQGSGNSRVGLSSQGSVTVTSDHRYVYAVNAGTNDMTAFSIHDNPIGLTFIGKVPSGGIFPAA
jgi:6-phosphogluconolactonase (cycloisomerase 2 family)